MRGGLTGGLIGFLVPLAGLAAMVVGPGNMVTTSRSEPPLFFAYPAVSVLLCGAIAARHLSKGRRAAASGVGIGLALFLVCAVLLFLAIAPSLAGAFKALGAGLG